LTNTVQPFIIRVSEDRIMNVVVQSHIQGTFLGYAPGIVHRLDDGSEGEQVGIPKEYVYRERPGCKVFFERERLWIDVEGTSGIAEVERYMGKRWAGAGGI
jgi:hypothetical protein